MHSLRQFAEVRAKAIAAKSQKGTEHKIQDEHIVAAFETLDQHLIDEALNSIGNKLDRVDIHGENFILILYSNHLTDKPISREKQPVNRLTDEIFQIPKKSDFERP